MATMTEKPEQTNDPKLREAASKLHFRLTGSKWFTAVGIGVSGGAAVLYVYTNRKPPTRDADLLPDRWGGFNIIVKQIGPVVPLSVR